MHDASTDVHPVLHERSLKEFDNFHGLRDGICAGSCGRMGRFRSAVPSVPHRYAKQGPHASRAHGCGGRLVHPAADKLIALGKR